MQKRTVPSFLGTITIGKHQGEVEVRTTLLDNMSLVLTWMIFHWFGLWRKLRMWIGGWPAVLIWCVASFDSPGLMSFGVKISLYEKISCASWSFSVVGSGVSLRCLSISSRVNGEAVVGDGGVKLAVVALTDAVDWFAWWISVDELKDELWLWLVSYTSAATIGVIDSSKGKIVAISVWAGSS